MTHYGYSRKQAAKALAIQVRELLAKMRRREMEKDIKKSDGLLREPAALGYAFIKDHQKEYLLTFMCQVLEVARTSYHDWLGRPARACRTLDLDQRRKLQLHQLDGV